MKVQEPFRTANAVTEILQRGLESRKRYFRRSFLLSVRRSLFKLRHEAGKTQAEIAGALGTTQSAIARLEKIDPANITLGRLVDYALACGAAPLDLSFVSVQQLTEFTMAQPELLRTADAFARWTIASYAGDFIKRPSQANPLPRLIINQRLSGAKPAENPPRQAALSESEWSVVTPFSNGKEQTVEHNIVGKDLARSNPKLTAQTLAV